MKITISTTKYNEVNPKEIKKLLDLGGKIVHCSLENGVICYYDIKTKIKAYSVDDIQIGNVTLPLSKGDETEYTETITINIWKTAGY